ncbi:MAG: hypothetical protein Q7T41_02605 [Candidatus Saccharibacteria bacterium]|nr:hypothetical protein [Candidatus Saccharibacteria bacterium]
MKWLKDSTVGVLSSFFDSATDREELGVCVVQVVISIVFCILTVLLPLNFWSGAAIFILAYTIGYLMSMSEVTDNIEPKRWQFPYYVRSAAFGIVVGISTQILMFLTTLFK